MHSMAPLNKLNEIPVNKFALKEICMSKKHVDLVCIIYRETENGKNPYCVAQ